MGGTDRRGGRRDTAYSVAAIMVTLRHPNHTDAGHQRSSNSTSNSCSNSIVPIPSLSLVITRMHSLRIQIMLLPLVLLVVLLMVPLLVVLAMLAIVLLLMMMLIMIIIVHR